MKNYQLQIKKFKDMIFDLSQIKKNEFSFMELRKMKFFNNNYFSEYIEDFVKYCMSDETLKVSVKQKGKFKILYFQNVKN